MTRQFKNEVRDLNLRQLGTTSGESLMRNSLSDDELMLHVRNGVGEMLGVLFDRYQGPLFSFYCRLTGDRTLSEDLVQDVFFRILKYRQTYRPGTPFRAWMYQIARNARHDYARKRRPEANAVSLEAEMEPTTPENDSTQQKEEAALLHRALLELPEEKREVLLLSRFQELKYDEIAKLLNCEVGTVKTRVHRALQELRLAFHRLSTTPDNPAARRMNRAPQVQE
jgi:RNA polymerase sigma-70 factor (ECF subfamily)